MDLRARRGLIGSNARFPSAYQEVEYIESTGTQWLSARFNPRANDVITLDMAYTTNNTSSVGISYLGNNKNPYNYSRVLVGVRDGYFVTFIGYSFGCKSDVPIDTARHKFVFDIGSFTTTIDDNVALVEPTKDFRYQTYAYYVLFATIRNERDVLCASCRVYNLKVAEGNTITHDLIPCYRKADGEIGMYDRVTRIFIANSGTGTFLKGADV